MLFAVIENEALICARLPGLNGLKTPVNARVFVWRRQLAFDFCAESAYFMISKARADL